MKRAIIFSLGVVMLSGLAAVVARGASGSATGTANGATVRFHFPTAADTAPSVPGDFQIADSTSTTLTLSWSASTPAVVTPPRTIHHYEVLLNGSKILQTSGTEAVVDIDPSGPMLQFFTVRAVDNKGVASALSDEVSPRVRPGSITLETKLVTAARIRDGFAGLLVILR